MPKNVAKDHLGNTYSSLQAMQRAYADRVQYSTLLHRLDAGWSLEEVINGRHKKGKKVIYQRKMYVSITNFCKYWGLDTNVVAAQIKHGKTIAKIMTDNAKKYQAKLKAYRDRIAQKISGMDEWHSRRYNGIGGSEIASVMNLNQFQTAYDLWAVKTARKEPFQGNAITEFGHIFEDVVAKKYEEMTGNKVDVDTTHYTGSSVGADFLVGNIDRMITLQDGSKRILECKTARDPYQTEGDDAKWGDGNIYSPMDKSVSKIDDRVPTNYFLQVQHYMLITGIDTCDLCVMFRNDCSIRIYTIKREPAICEKIVSYGREFWNCVLDDKEPKMTCKDFDKSKDVKEKAIEIGKDDYVNLVQKYRNLQNDKKVIEYQIDALAEKIKERIGNNEYLSFNGKNCLSYKLTISQRLDTTKLKTEDPKTYEKYLKESACRKLLLCKTK